MGVARAEPAVNAVSGISVREEGATTVVTIRGSTTPTFTVYKLERPERVVVDLANARLGGDVEPMAVNGWAVGQVSAQALAGDDAAVVRVLVGFARPSEYHVKAAGRDVVVSVSAREPKPVEAASDARRSAAEDAAARAEARRVEAEKGAAQAEARRGAAEQAASAAQAEKEKAELETAAAAARTAQAADAAARAAAARKDAEAKRAEAEAALGRLEGAKTQAETALARLEDAKKKAEAAGTAAEARRAEAERAASKAAALAQDARASEEQIAKARAVARRLADERQAAERALEARRQELAGTEARARELESARARASEDVATAQRAAEAARALRAQEDKERAEVATARAAEEKALAGARAQRADEEAKLAAAETRRQRADEQAAQTVARAKAAGAAERAAAEKAAAEATARAEAADAESQRLAAAAKARIQEAEHAAAAATAHAREVDEQARHAADARVAAADAEATRLAAAKVQAAEADAARARGEAKAAAAEAARLAAAHSAETAARQSDESERSRKAQADADRAAARLKTAEAEVARAEARAREVDAQAQARVKAAEAEAARTIAEARQARDGEEARRGEAERAANAATARARAAEGAASAASDRARAADSAASAAGDRARAADSAASAASERERAANSAASAATERARAADSAASAASDRVRGAETPAGSAGTTGPATGAGPATAHIEATAPPTGARVRLTDVDYLDRPEAARVVLALDGKAEARVVAASEKQVIVELAGVDIPTKLERSLDTREFDGPVQSVASYRDPRQPGRVRVVVDLMHGPAPVLNRAGNTLYVDFARQVAARRAHSAVYAPPIVGGYGVATTPITSQTVAQQGAATVRGQRIGLDAVDADLHNLMRLFAVTGNVDIVVPEEVKGSVTVRLTNVPWRQAMEMVLQSKGLWYRQEGRIIRVANRKDLDAEDQAERERQRARMQEERPETEVFTLNYSTAAEVLPQVASLLSPKGHAVIDARTNSLILTDVAGNRAGVIRLLRRLDTQTPQIQIEARVVEARSTWTRQLGVQWGFNGQSSVAGGNPTGLVFPSNIGVAGGATDGQAPKAGLINQTNPDFAVNLPIAVGTGNGGALGFTFGSIGGNFNVSLRLSAAETDGNVRIISAPKITVLNNRNASIQQGVSIPISVVSAAGVQTQFVPADLSLTATPHVSQRDCSIVMDVDVKKNEADFVNTGARGDPSILRKEAKTTLLIADGETSVIGGIYTRNTGVSYSKVPWFADIPIIGFFFRNKRENDDRTEVLIFLTPRITNKASLRCETLAERH
jgi:type IV pilus assembly protein PilQ